MNLSSNDQLLMGTDGTPNIQPNSQYDQSINFSDSDSGQDYQMNQNQPQFNPGEYSPRPGMDPMQAGRPQGPGSAGLRHSGGSDDQFGGFGGINAGGVFGRSNFGGNDDLGMGSSGGIGGFGGNNFGGFAASGAGGGFDFGNDPATKSPELVELFGLITEFQPTKTELPPHFKPFLPDLIPAIGAIDAFIKVPRPDDEFEPLGLTILDEPTIGCSDPQIIRMQLREKYGIVSNKEGDGYIGYIEDLENNQKELDTFLENYEELIRDRPPPTIVYSYKMPDLNELLLEWPADLEKALQSIPLPSADMDLTIEEYAKIICAFLDIPVKGNIIESLHVLFTLFMTFEENQHFPENDAPKAPGEERIFL